MSKSQQLTSSQNRVYQAIVEHMATNTIPPTTRELADKLKIKAPSVHEQLKRLEAKGFINLRKGMARGIELTSYNNVIKSSTFQSVPVIGTIAAGKPILAQENFETELLIDSSLVGHGQLFGLRVQGESMINADIQNGDIVIVRKQPTADNGDIVAAQIDNEATVKQLKIGTDGTIQLLPANPDFQPIDVTDNEDFRILGKVVRTFHSANNSDSIDNN